MDSRCRHGGTTGNREIPGSRTSLDIIGSNTVNHLDRHLPSSLESPTFPSKVSSIIFSTPRSTCHHHSHSKQHAHSRHTLRVTSSHSAHGATTFCNGIFERQLGFMDDYLTAAATELRPPRPVSRASAMVPCSGFDRASERHAKTTPTMAMQTLPGGVESI